MSQASQDLMAKLAQLQVQGPLTPPQPGTLSKLGAGAKSDLKSLLFIPEGLYSMAKPLAPWTKEKPSETYLPMAKGMVDYYKGYLDNPKEMILNHPINTLLDAASLVSGAGALLKGGAGMAGRAGMISAGRAAQLGKIGELAKTPIASMVKLPMNKAMQIAAAEELAGKIPETMSIPGKIGHRIMGIQTQDRVTSLFNEAKAGRYGKLTESTNEVFGKIPDLTASETGAVAQYLQIPRNRLAPEIVQAVESNPKLKQAAEGIKFFGQREAEAMMKENPAKWTPEAIKARSIKPIAIGDLRSEFGAEWDRMPKAVKDIKIGEQIKKISSLEDTGNLAYVPHLNAAAELRGRSWFAGLIPNWQFLRKGTLPDYLKEFKGGREAPVNLRESVLRREFMKVAHEENPKFIDRITQEFGKVWDKKSPVQPHQILYNPTLDIHWARATQNAYRYISRNIDRLGEVGARRVNDAVDGVYSSLREVVENAAQTGQTIAPTFHADAFAHAGQMVLRDGLEKMKTYLGIIQDSDPALMDHITEGLGPHFTELFKSVVKGKMDESAQIMSRVMDKHPTYIMPRIVKQVLDRSGNFDEYSRIARGMIDKPIEMWRTAVLGLSPRWFVYNALGNITQNVLHMTGPTAYKEALTKTANGFYFPEAKIADVFAYKKALKAGLVFDETKLGRAIELPQNLKQTLAAVEGHVSRTSGRYLPGAENVQSTIEKYLGPKAGQYTRGRLSADLKNFEETGIAPFQTTAPGSWQRLYRTAKADVGKVTGFITEANNQMENFFRTALYIDEAGKTALRERMASIGIKGAIFDQAATKESMIKLMKDPAGQRAIMDTVNDFMFDYNNIPMKTTMRRIMPFYSFYYNMTRLTFWTLPAKYPGRTAMLYKLGEMGKQAWNEDLKSMGLKGSDLPDWMWGSIPVGYDPATKTLTFWNTQGPNIFQTVAMPNLLSSLNPMAKIALERLLHRDIFRNKAFTSPFVSPDYSGKIRDASGKVISGVNPPLSEHIMMQIPQYQALKDIFRWRQFGTIPLEYSTNTLFNPQPVTIKGRPQMGRGLMQSTLPKLAGLSIGKISVSQQKPVGRAQKQTTTKIKRQIQELERANKLRKE